MVIFNVKLYVHIVFCILEVDNQHNYYILTDIMKHDVRNEYSRELLEQALLFENFNRFCRTLEPIFKGKLFSRSVFD